MYVVMKKIHITPENGFLQGDKLERERYIS